MIHKLKKKLKRVKNVGLPRLFSKSRMLSSLYYFCVSGAFRREHQAVVAGKLKHIEDIERSKNNYYLLTRNTHRIEKGLLMRPRRAVFAKDYIKETIDCFEGVWKENVSEYDKNPQLKWFHDVLTRYFETSGPDKLVDSLRERFTSTLEAHPHQTATVDSVPYHRTLEAGISYEAFYNLTKVRRSVRWFLDKPVPRDLIDKAIVAAGQAPSACNRQPFEYHIIDDPEILKVAVDIPMGTRGYAQNIPVFIVVVGNLDAYFDERDRHLIYVDASLANMQMMLCLETLGLSSCPINWPDIESKEVKMASLLKLKRHQRPIMCMGIGYPDPEGMVAFSEKKPLEILRKYI